TEHDGVTRIDVRDDAAVRPGPGQGDPAAEKDEPVSDS
ncbi:MAG: cation/multidrug efflux pump, partial [Microbacterium sp.]|nr:cation/multidrug efflux pump [Microbacterium sp.]